MIYPLLFLLCLASLSEGCAPHSPKRRPPPQPPVTPPVTPKMCSELPVDSSCTDCTPETNSKTEIKCAATGKNLLVIVDTADKKTPVTEAKCDSATGKWAFKNGAAAVAVEPAKVYCSTECEEAGTCEKVCPALESSVIRCQESLFTGPENCEVPATNDLKEIKCAAGEHPALVVLSKNEKDDLVTEAKCDPATGEWAFKNAAGVVEIDEAKTVFCTKECALNWSCPTCTKIPSMPVPADCTGNGYTCAGPDSTPSGELVCPASHPIYRIRDTSGTIHSLKTVVCTDLMWVFTDKTDTVVTIEPDRMYCQDTE